MRDNLTESIVLRVAFRRLFQTISSRISGGSCNSAATLTNSLLMAELRPVIHKIHDLRL